MILGGNFQKWIFKTVIVILWKSDNLVSISLVWNERSLFIRIRSIQLAFLGFSEHVGCFIRLLKGIMCLKFFFNTCIKITKNHNCFVFTRIWGQWLTDNIKMFSNVTLMGIIGTVNEPFLLIEGNLYKKNFPVIHPPFMVRSKSWTKTFN